MSQTVRNNFIRELPKLELHCHLDGSLTQKSIEEIMERPVVLSELQVEPDCRNLAEYLQNLICRSNACRPEKGSRKPARSFCWMWQRKMSAIWKFGLRPPVPLMTI